MDLLSTIAAICTPYGTGGISVIRISGPDAIKVADSAFLPSSKVPLQKALSHTVSHGHILSEDKKVIDEVMACVMRAPRTYTGEDTVEISCHGGMLVTKLVLERVLKAGAVNAGRGEFTKRAFLNGKIDLCRAEAVIDVINSKTNLEQEISVNNLGGALSESINAIRERIIALLANIGVLIDYPDEGLESIGDEEFEKELIAIKDELQKLYDTSNAGLVLKNGVPSCIVGKPNVGKSSLFNLLSGEERAIVTDIEGTTRDAIEESISLGGVTLYLADTAGIRSTDDEVEKIGVKKSLEYIAKSELVIFVADATSGLDERDKEIIDAVSGKKAIALINKSDKKDGRDFSLLAERFGVVIDFSVKEKQGLKPLTEAVRELFELGELEGATGAVVTNARHRDAIYKAKQAIESALMAIENMISIDTTYIDLEQAASLLGEIVGKTVSEEVVDQIFHKFCVGK